MIQRQQLAKPSVEKIYNGLINRLNPTEEFLSNTPNLVVGLFDKNQPGMYLIDTDVMQINYLWTGHRHSSIIIHELMHSTGHATRLNRIPLLKQQYGIMPTYGIYSVSYCVEECVAEIAQAIIESYLGTWNPVKQENFRYTLRQFDTKEMKIMPLTMAMKAIKYYFDIPIIPHAKRVKQFMEELGYRTTKDFSYEK